MLDTDSWQRVEDLFAEALALPGVDRSAFLDEACSGEDALRAEIESLLASYEKSDTFLTSMDAKQAEALMKESSRPEPRDGERIGPWKIVRELGRGGMGVVYLAERADGQFERKVALKLVKRGMDSEAILARFLNERQVLATLQHPHIARLYDGGITEEGQPYFAMEYVDGIPITDYCNEKGLSIDERLALFVKVCRAVEHAHNRLIIHRDLKPSNILVTENGNPRLLDFGLAKVLQDPTGDPATTRREQRWLTLEYASPEQVKGESVGTPSDTYQLGLVLYELLTGRRAYTVSGLSPTEAERVICKEDPLKPSTAVVSIGDVGIPPGGGMVAQKDRQKLRKRLRGDLDTIILKALHKDPERGYASAEVLAADIERHLDGLAIHARPDTTGYRVQKFVRRHKMGVTGAAAFVLLLVASIIALATQQAETVRERDRAEQEAAKAEEVIGYLTGLFKSNDPAVAQGDTVTVREILERGVEHAEVLGDQPELQATLFEMTGEIYYNLGNLVQAEAYHRRALAIWEDTNAQSETNGEYIRVLFGLGRTIAAQGRYADAEPILRRVAGEQRIAGGGAGLLQGALFEHYSVLHALGRREAAEDAFAVWEEVVERSRVAPDAETADRMVRFGQNLGYRGQVSGDLESLHRGQTFIRRAISILQEVRGPRHPSVGQALNELGSLLIVEATLEPRSAQARSRRQILVKADSVTRQAVTLHRTIHSEPNMATWDALQQRSEVLRELGRYHQSEKAIREALSIAEAVVGTGAQSWIVSEEGFGLLLLAKGDFEEAEVRLRKVRNWWFGAYGNEYLNTLITVGLHAESLISLKRFEEAEEQLVSTYEILEGQRGSEDRFTKSALRHLVALYESWGKPEEAAHYRALL